MIWHFYIGSLTLGSGHAEESEETPVIIAASKRKSAPMHQLSSTKLNLNSAKTEDKNQWGSITTKVGQQGGNTKNYRWLVCDLEEDGSGSAVITQLHKKPLAGSSGCCKSDRLTNQKGGRLLDKQCCQLGAGEWRVAWSQRLDSKAVALDHFLT